jgi:uncharacterized OB-fold protein
VAMIPLVDYLVVDGEPHLVAQECDLCSARFFDRRDACAGCSGTSFHPIEIATEGTVRTFTIVALAAPGIAVPYIAAVVDCDGTSVRANLVNVAADPAALSPGMKVRLTTVAAGTDSAGVEAVGYGFEPV